MDGKAKDVSRTEVIGQIDDWVRRLTDLYRQVVSWYLELPDARPENVLYGSILQSDEDLMDRFDVPPRMLPTLSLIHGKNRVSFVPSALWIISANGRVNVATNDRQFILVDVEGRAEKPSDWRIIKSKIRKERQPFDRELLRNLVLQREFEAA